MDNSILASIGGVLNYLFLPLGWGDNWELPAASLTGLIAKEDLIGTLEQLIAEPFDMDISDALAAMLSPAAILSFFTFNMFCAPCFAAMGAIHRELGDWKSTGFAFLYQCLLAYFVSVIVYVIYSAIDGNLGNIEMYSIIFAIIDFAIIVYFLVVKDPLKPFHRDKVAE
jgi:ferrous iron transport protein B